MQRTADVVWRLGDGCVLVCEVRPEDADRGTATRSATLVGAAAAVWVAAAIARTIPELVLDTDASPADVRLACELLLDAGWITAVP